MRFSSLFLLLLIGSASTDDCSVLLNTVAVSAGIVDGKCMAVTKSTVKGTATTACNSVGKGVKFDLASIDNAAENEVVKEGLLEANAVTAYIGLTLTDQWAWSNGDPSSYRKWENPPVTQPPTPAVTTTPLRTTYPPSNQRRSTAIVIGVDASQYSTNALTFAQVEFVRQLSRYIGDRGPAEFALFAYGCTQLNPFTLQYPNFVNTFSDTDDMIRNMNETINHDCTKVDPLDFKTMLRDQTLYYNRYSTSARPFKSGYISMIYFSSSTNSTNINAASSLWPLVNSSIITINVGSGSASIAPFSIPSGRNGLRVQSADDIIGLVPKVDSIIFGTSGAEQHFVHPDEQLNWRSLEVSSEAAGGTVTDCAYMNSTDGLWYSDGDCTVKRQFVCQYVMPTPAPPPTPNPTIEWSDPCYKEDSNFSYYPSLSNQKCYRLSASKKQFADAEETCLSDHRLFLHEPRLTSIQSWDEEEKLRTLTNVTSEGMFWFGLRRINSSLPWFFVNGDDFTDSYSNWRPGYPREADGCDCVALVVNDHSWINTDCNKNLYAICAYRYNSTDSITTKAF